MTYPPDQIKALASTAQLLAAIEPFELTGCAFGEISTMYVKTLRRDPQAETFRLREATFETADLPAVLLILMPMARPSAADPEVPTVRPFAEMLVRYGIRHARLVTPSQWTSWVEVTKGRDWRKVPPDFLAAPPAPTPTEETNDGTP